MEDIQVVSRDMAWASIPTDALLAELSRRDDSAVTKPQCGSGERGSYDTPLHVAALILILVLSSGSCAFPLFSRRSNKSQTRKTVLFYSQHFGTGVLLATAFVHLLPTAFVSLTHPCLPDVFNKGYNAFAGLTAMVFALLVVGVESVLAAKGAGHSHTHVHWEDDSDDGREATVPQLPEGLSARRAFGHRPSNIAMADMDASEGLMAGVSPLPGSTPTTMPIDKTSGHNGVRRSTDKEDSDDDDLEIDLDELDPTPYDGAQAPLALKAGRLRQHGSLEGGVADVPNPEDEKRLFLQCVLLEMGILFHSVFIGMALSVANGPSFPFFLAAIGFHQSFEGLALGSRIAALHFPRASPKPWIMVLAFGLTTPFGQFIGLIVHNLYDPRSQTGLLVVGFMNAISAGLLLFAGLVQLLAQDFLSEDSYRKLRGRRRAKAFGAVVAGALLMALVGAIA